MAAIMNDKHRAAARSGVGAVMGSKNLKAVVAMGKKNPAFFDDAGMRALSVELNKEVGADIKKGSSLREYGTAYVPQVTNTLGILPTRNFQTGTFEGTDKIDGVALKEKYLIRHTPCYRCPISCGRLTAVDDEKYAGKGEGPEYETHCLARLGLWRGQPGRADQGQLLVQRTRHGYHRHRHDDCRRDGNVREGLYF